MKKIILIGLTLIFSGIIANSLIADEINTGRFNNLAIGGYDPVAYHLLGKPQKGSKDFVVIWKGAEWRFLSQEHLDLFESDPETYIPQFGGFCANGLSDGHKIRGNPKIWRVYNDKLFLFYSKNGKESWILDTDNKINLASDYWEKVKYD
ncbi:MAG: YHS domain-containing (seleno)protein [Spirochaetia bacterium]|jgi:YHS domain-containing protein|nr:YHS domain-containing (seleno)protein [Spirochaetia bacterium]